MKTSEAPGRHLTLDEIVDRVFTAHEDPVPVPLHLAACGYCQAKVLHLRESWLLDRGAVAGAVEALPAAFWNAQTASIMQAVEARPVEAQVHPFPFSFQRSFFRRPVLAFGSLAAALALVAGISFLRPRSPAQVAATKPTPAVLRPLAVEEQDKQDEELLRSIDDLLDDDESDTLTIEGIS